MERAVRTLVCTIGFLAAATPGLAWRAPTDHERDGISRAVETTGFDCDVYPAGYCHEKIRVSTVNERWAAKYFLPTRGHEDTVQGGVVSVERKHHRWRVHQAGNGGGCDMPSAVRHDLHLECF